MQECAELAGAVALAHYRTNVAVEWKRDGSPVTIADRGAEEAVREWIHARFPSDGILGEEFGEQPGTSGRRWVIDPIDGTKSFVRGVPLWGSLVAVVEGERVLAGAACFPAIGEVDRGGRGMRELAQRFARGSQHVADLSAATVFDHRRPRFRVAVGPRGDGKRLCRAPPR